MPDIPLEQPSALNLRLQGSSGRFQIGSDAAKSLEVKYFLTNVGLALGQGANDHLLSELAPVREVFKTDELGFDELMQRDIDDARVTSELVPYLLDYQTAGLVKLFPPIVVMVLPKAHGEDRPLRLYPVTSEHIETKDDIETKIVRIGQAGSELLTLEQPVLHGQPLDHDRVRLSLNTHATRLVIVDGQHRAMALLAIFRNLQDQWSDARRAPYKDFYAEWTPQVIGDFQLDHVQLPVMLCFVPELNEGTDHDFDLVRAARQVFLTLNKTARKVSVSRNRLLDDADLMAAFLRSTLEEIKGREAGDTSNMRLWSMELDQAADRVRIQSPTALTGVSHIYYAVEHLMLNSDDVHGLRARTGRYSTRTNLSDCLYRLDGRDLLGDDTADAMRRDLFSTSDEAILSKAFMEKYGQYIVAMFDRFGPYAIHNQAVNSLEMDLRKDADSRVHSLLFGAQGSLGVFLSHKQILTRRDDVEDIQELLTRVNELEQRVNNAVNQIRENRAKLFLQRALGETDPAIQSLKSIVGDMYRNYFTSVAMQAAILGTFFGELEQANRTPGTSITVESEYDAYLDAISRFFSPTSKQGLEGLIRVFGGEIAPASDDPWRVVPSDQTFRRVVFSQEMQPDQWPKLRYLLLELWTPSNGVLNQQVSVEVIRCRQEVMKALFSRSRAHEASTQGIPEDDLTTDQLHAVAMRCVEAVGALIDNLHASRSFSREEAMEWALGPPTTDVAETDDDAEEA